MVYICLPDNSLFICLKSICLLGTLLEACRVCLNFQHTDHFMTFPIPGQRKPTLLGCFSICAVGSPSFLDSSVPLRGSGLMCGGRRKPTRFLTLDCPSGLERLFSPKLNTEVYRKYVFFRGHILQSWLKVDLVRPEFLMSLCLSLQSFLYLETTCHNEGTVREKISSLDAVQQLRLETLSLRFSALLLARPCKQ